MIYTKDGTPVGEALTMARLNALRHRVPRPAASKYTGEKLRELRADRGVGRRNLRWAASLDFREVEGRILMGTVTVGRAA